MPTPGEVLSVCANPEQKRAARNCGSGSLSPQGLGFRQPATRQGGGLPERIGPAPGRPIYSRSLCNFYRLQFIIFINPDQRERREEEYVQTEEIEWKRVEEGREERGSLSPHV